MDDSSSVKVNEPATTIRLLRKYCPIEACVQARVKFSQRSVAGSCQGLKKISWSDLKAVITIQASGKITSTAQLTSSTCETPVRAKAPGDQRSRARAQLAGAARAVGAVGTWPASLSIRPPLRTRPARGASGRTLATKVSVS